MIVSLLSFEWSGYSFYYVLALCLAHSRCLKLEHLVVRLTIISAYTSFGLALKGLWSVWSNSRPLGWPFSWEGLGEGHWYTWRDSVPSCHNTPIKSVARGKRVDTGYMFIIYGTNLHSYNRVLAPTWV